MHMHDKLPWLYSVVELVVTTPNANPNPTTSIYHIESTSSLFP